MFFHDACHRWQNGFLARFCSTPLLLVCIVRTCIELFLIASTGQSGQSWQWFRSLSSTVSNPKYENSGESAKQLSQEWQSLAEFVCLYQMGVISSLLSVFVCQNVILVALSARIFLARNYSAVVQTLNKSKRVQIFISFTFHSFIFFLFHFLYDNNNNKN